MDILKISARSNSIAAAGALANTIRQHGEAELQVIGPKAVNQAVKAIAIARSYLASSGIDLVAVPSFVDVEIEGQMRTGIRFRVKPRHLMKEEKLRPAQPEPAKEEAPEEAAPQPQPTPSLAEAIAGSSAQEFSEDLEKPQTPTAGQAPGAEPSESEPTRPEPPESDLDREQTVP